MFKRCSNWLALNSVVLLFLLTLILFTSKSLYNYPVSIMALLGLIYLLKAPVGIWQSPATRAYIILFMCLWLPLLFSYPDAVNPERSVKTVFPYLRFLFMGIFVIEAIRNIQISNRIHLLIFILMSFWCLDGVIQYFFTYNLLGFPKSSGYITGVFFPEITIGHISAALSPLYFEFVRRSSHKYKWLWVLLLPLFAVVLLSGRRAAWIMLAVSTMGYLFYYLKLNRYELRIIKRLSVVGIFLLISLSMIVASNAPMQKRIAVTSNVLSGDYELINDASGKRLHLWETSVNIFRANWINGVGPRGFRFVYQDYSASDNYFHEIGQTHPHQMLLEIAAETGMLGIVGLLLFVFLLYRFIKVNRLGMTLFPWYLSIIVVLFPINTHMAFYGSYWSSIFWWLMALSFATASIQLIENKQSTEKRKNQTDK